MKIIKVIAAVIKYEGKYMIAKRKNKGPLGGYWEFPGGKVEEGETTFQTIKREIKEEMDINITPIKIIGNNKHEYEFAIIDITFVECTTTEIKDIKLLDHDEIKFVNIEELKMINLAPADIPIISKLN